MRNKADELFANYRRMADGELLELASQKEQLTPEAVTALESELADRGITEEALKTETADDSPDEHPEPTDYLHSEVFGDEHLEMPSSDLAAVYSAEGEADAKAVQKLLSDAGIESQLQIVVLVAEDKAEDAIKIVSAQVDKNQEGEDETE